MRVYRKRIPEQRHCVHCTKSFESAHKRRIYCGNSCSTLAYYARRRVQSVPVDRLSLTGPLLEPAARPLLAAAPVATSAPLPMDLQTVGVVVVGTVGLRLLDKLLEPAPAATTPPAASLPVAIVPVDPASWFPAAVLAAPAAALLVHHPELYASLNSGPVVSRERCNFHYLTTDK